MNVLAKRIPAAVLAISAAFVGGWAAAAPHSFYRDFPYAGRQWVSMLGPYNEHLIRDVGGLYLALLVVTVWVTVRPAEQSLRVVGLAWVVFGVQHVAYHARHLAMFPRFDQITMMVALGAIVVLAALLMLPSGPGVSSRRTRSPRDPA